MALWLRKSVDASVDDINEDIPLKLGSLANELFGCDFSELTELEQNNPTCEEHIDWNKPTQEP